MKIEIYDELSRVLTDYEGEKCNKEDLYDILIKIQNEWSSIISSDIE